MFKLSDLSTNFDKLYNKTPYKIMVFIAIIMKGRELLTVCSYPQNDPYPFTQGKVKYEKYFCGYIGKLKVSILKDKMISLSEMINADVPMKILYDYVKNNLLFSMK